MRASLVPATLVLALAACRADSIVRPVDSTLRAVTLVTSRSTYAPANGRVAVDATLRNRSADTVLVSFCGQTLQRLNADQWQDAATMYCIAIYPGWRPVAPGDTARISTSWGDTTSGRYRLAIGVGTAPDHFEVIHSTEFTIQSR